MLEDEMSLDLEEPLQDAGGTRTDSSLRASRGLAKLRELLEKECEAQVQRRAGVLSLKASVMNAMQSGHARAAWSRVQACLAVKDFLAMLRKLFKKTSEALMLYMLRR